MTQLNPDTRGRGYFMREARSWSAMLLIIGIELAMLAQFGLLVAAPAPGVAGGPLVLRAS